MDARPPRPVDLRLASTLDETGDVSFAQTMVRPLAILHGDDAAQAVEAGFANRIADGPCAYGLIEVIEGGGAFDEQDLRTARQAVQLRAPHVIQRLGMLHQSRPPIAGLTWTRPRVLAHLPIAGHPNAPGERSANAAEQRGRLLAADGADIISVTISGRHDDAVLVILENAVRALSDSGLRVAVSTRSAEVIRAAGRGGARLIIDDAMVIDDEALYALGDTGLPVVLHHRGAVSGGKPPGAGRSAIARDVHRALEDRIALCEGAGIPRDRMIVNPGIQAGKSREEGVALLHDLSLFHGLGCPLFVDFSRGDDGEGRYGGGTLHSTDLAMAALRQGAQIVALDEPSRAWSLVATYCAEHEARPINQD